MKPDCSAVGRKWVNRVIRSLFQGVFLRGKERNGGRVGRERRSKESVLWLEKIKRFHTDENDPVEKMLKIQEGRELQEHDFE